MKRKLMIGSILAALMLVAISYATAVSTQTAYGAKESPLYRIRTSRAIAEKIGTILDSIKANFIGERLFFLRSNHLQLLSNFEDIAPRCNLFCEKTQYYDTYLCGCP